jgi:hypothetical protein
MSPQKHAAAVDSRRDLVFQEIESAREMVRALNRPRGTEGARDWSLSIPARPFHDPDIVISTALDVALEFIDETMKAKEAAEAERDQTVRWYIDRYETLMAWARTQSADVLNAVSSIVANNLPSPWANHTPSIIGRLQQQLAASEKRSGEYRKALEEIRTNIVVNAPDTVWFSKHETMVDYLDAALADPQHGGGDK